MVWLFTATVISAGDPLHVKPTESLSNLRERLANDTSITEVIFEKGVYSGGLHVSGPKATDFSQRSLVIRAADGAKVVFDGARVVEQFQPHEKLPGVFHLDYEHRGGEYPKLWEPGTRMRYRLVADSEAVARFPATYTVEGQRLLFHTSDGQTPRRGDVLMSAEDCGIFINRPYVTVRGIAFQNYLARDKYSTGIDLRVDQLHQGHRQLQRIQGTGEALRQPGRMARVLRSGPAYHLCGPAVSRHRRSRLPSGPEESQPRGRRGR